MSGMSCSHCGGIVVWRGPLTALTHTECTHCHATNCQVGPAEELQEALERRDHWFARAEEWKDASYKELMKRQAVEAELANQRAIEQTFQARVGDQQREIDRLTERDAQWNDKWKETVDLMGNAQAEAKRLQAALEHAQKEATACGQYFHEYKHNFDEIAKIARQALTPAPDHAAREGS